MSSYMCENFQLFILYNFQFHHMVLKLILDVDFLHMRIFPYDGDFLGSVVGGLLNRSKMVSNHAVTCSSFTYGKNAGSSKLLVELITIVNKACETAHFYDMIFI